jgi:hypothetical protein
LFATTRLATESNPENQAILFKAKQTREKEKGVTWKTKIFQQIEILLLPPHKQARFKNKTELRLSITRAWTRLANETQMSFSRRFSSPISQPSKRRRTTKKLLLHFKAATRMRIKLNFAIGGKFDKTSWRKPRQSRTVSAVNNRIGNSLLLLFTKVRLKQTNRESDSQVRRTNETNNTTSEE